MLRIRNKRWKQTPWVMAIALTCLAGAPFGTSVASAQDAPESDPQQLLEDYVHYVMIANFELAEANARALLDMGMTPVELVDVVESEPRLEQRFAKAFRDAQRVPSLEDVSAALHEMYESGRRARARDPQEIARNIDLLDDNRRAQLLARDRLAAAGEYAIPQLLNILMERGNPTLRSEVQQLLVDKMGRQAVAPLSVALPDLPVEAQETVARILGRIPYRASLPFLYELAATSDVSHVRDAAERAIRNIDGAYDQGADPASRYRELAEQYYAEPASLTSFPGESHQLLWEYNPGIGLTPTAILTEVYHEAKAMDLARRALDFDPSDEFALSLWIAANFSREIDQPEGYENPAWPEGRRDAMYFAVAAGAATSQDVLQRALTDRDTPLARRAIEALSRSASGVNMDAGFASEMPLVQALYYPDRRVQYEAALALGRTNPANMFDGAERVTPLLASAIREASKRYAVVVADDIEDQQRYRALLEGEGFTVLPPGRDLNQVADAIAETPGVDLLVARTTANSLIDLIDAVRASSRLAATPVLGMTSFTGVNQYSSRFEGDALTRLVREGVSNDEMTEAVSQLVVRASGAPVTDNEAEAYAMSALDVLHEVSLSRNGVLRVGDASLPLIAALDESDGEVRIRVADILARIDQERAQSAIMDAALAAGGDERIELLEKVISSARRFGNKLERRQIEELITVAEVGDDDEATVAAALMGALDLPREELVPLVVGF